jgi:hypothetical protein
MFVMLSFGFQLCMQVRMARQTLENYRPCRLCIYCELMNTETNPQFAAKVPTIEYTRPVLCNIRWFMLCKQTSLHILWKWASYFYCVWFNFKGLLPHVYYSSYTLRLYSKLLFHNWSHRISKEPYCYNASFILLSAVCLHGNLQKRGFIGIVGYIISFSGYKLYAHLLDTTHSLKLN